MLKEVLLWFLTQMFNVYLVIVLVHSLFGVYIECSLLNLFKLFIMGIIVQVINDWLK